MKSSCEWIPSVKGKPSNLFKDLMDVTGDRERARQLYALSIQKDVQKVLKIDRFDELGEPRLTDILESVGDPATFLGRDSYRKYIGNKENLSQWYSSFEEAFSKEEEVRNKYRTYAFNVTTDGKKFRVNISDKSVGLNKMKETVFNGTLQNKLLGILRRLGFDVERNSTVDNAGRLSASKARENAEGLKTVIQVAQGVEGEQAFPEEFAHLMIEGLHAHPLVIRMLDRLNDEAVREVLGEDYGKYKDLYSGNKDLLKREAAGKILADAILRGNRDPLAERVYTQSMQRLSKGSIRDVDSAIREAEAAASAIAEGFEEPETMVYFDRDAVLNAPEFYKLKGEISELGKAAERAYEIMHKKVKIASLRSKVRQQNSRENQTIAKMRDYIKKKEYASSCFAFLDFVLDDVQNMYDRIWDFKESYNKEKGLKIDEINKAFKLLRRISTSLSAYKDVVDTLTAVSSMEGIDNELLNEDIIDLERKAKEVQALYHNIMQTYKKARFNTIFEFFRYYWGDDKIIRSMNGKEEFTLEDILSMAPPDISGVSRLFNSMEDAADSVLAITDNIFKQVMHERDQQVFAFIQNIKAVHEAYVKETGSRDTSFMYEVDENGELTGMIISDIDHARYYKERREFIMKLKNEGLSQDFISARLLQWEQEHTENVDIGGGTIEKRPKRKLYPSDALDRLTAAQRKYYDDIMTLKKKLDSLLPSKYLRTYRAVQKRATASDAILGNVTNPRKAINQIKGALRSSWIRTVDDTEFGEILDEDGNIVDGARQRQILLDFAGNPVSKVPTDYIARLEDMSALSTDFTDSLIAFAGMAVNYDKMSRIADAMETIKDFIGDRDIQQTAGKNILYEKFKGEKGKVFTRPYVKKGINSEIYKAFDNYLKINLYGRHKDEEVLYVGDKAINYGKVGDNFKWYTTLIGMGYNIFSFGSNVTMGNAQLFIEAMGGIANKNTYNLKDLAKAVKFYAENLPGGMIDHYRDIPQNKLTLLLAKFDPAEDFQQDVVDANTARGATARTLSIFNPLSGMSAGEHYLHSIVMAAYLNHIKVEVNGVKTTLLDAFKVTESETLNKGKATIITLPKGTTINGKPVTEKMLFDIKRQLQIISHRINGAYGEIDKGQINTSVLGRLLTQYRQWMPSFIMSRFKTPRYNAASGETEEGFYNTFLKFTVGSIADLFKAKFTIATRWKQFTPTQKGNMIKALTELGLFTFLTALLHFVGAPDKDDGAALNYLRYMGYRLKLELGSAAPTPALIENALTLFQSPIPALEKSDYIINLMNLWNLFDTVESGKFEGWNKYVRNLYYAVPFARNIGRGIDMYKGDYSMFDVYLR